MKFISVIIKNVILKFVKILFIGYNVNVFDILLFIWSIVKYIEMEFKFKELDLLFVDSLVLIRYFLKENN